MMSITMQDLEDWQKEFLDGLREKGWTVEEPVAEPEESDENKLRTEIESSLDCECLVMRPKGNNVFNNISVEIIRSKVVGKQMRFLYKYKSLKRNGKLVGREGGVSEVVISDYSSEKVNALEKQYSVIEEM